MEKTRKFKNLSLKQAIQLFKKERHAPGNSYEWYRKQAQQNGKVLIGDISIPVFKDKGIWFVDPEGFASTIKQHHKKLELIKQNTEDYKKGIIHGKNGDIIEIEGGGYKISENFRFEWSDYERARGKSDGMWYCNNCNIPADTEHNREKCHICEDWYGCGRDCTISRVFCSKCGKELKL